MRNHVNKKGRPLCRKYNISHIYNFLCVGYISNILITRYCISSIVSLDYEIIIIIISCIQYTLHIEVFEMGSDFFILKII